MTKHVNPFYTIEESIAVLKSLGADPLCNLSAGQYDWRKDVLSVYVVLLHDKGSYYRCDVHMVDEGFDVFAGLVEQKPTVSIFTSDYDMHAIEISPELRIYKLVEREAI